MSSLVELQKGDRRGIILRSNNKHLCAVEAGVAPQAAYGYLKLCSSTYPLRNTFIRRRSEFKAPGSKVDVKRRQEIGGTSIAITTWRRPAPL